MRLKICLPTGGALALLVCGCQRDEIAPDCFLREGGECVVIKDADVPGELSVDCGSPPDGAVSANYSHKVDFEGDMPLFMAEGLPPGLSIGGTTGEISGQPTMEGTFNVTVRISDEHGNTEMSQCEPFTIGPELSHDLFDLPPEAPLGCVPVGVDLRDLIIPGTGDGTPIRCTSSVPDPDQPSCPLGDGNGIMPAGVTFDDASCTATGTPSEDRHGTWVWMVKLEQSGFSLWMPVCASKDTGPFHDVGIVLNAQPHDDLAPFITSFVRQDPLVFGGGMQDPEFQITSACGGGSCNNWGYEFSAACSPFNLPFDFQPDGSYEPMGMKLGFTHEMTASTQNSPVDDPSKDGDSGERTWVANFRIWYCTSGNAMDCDTDAPDFQDKAQTRYTVSIIAHPQ